MDKEAYRSSGPGDEGPKKLSPAEEGGGHGDDGVVSSWVNTRISRPKRRSTARSTPGAVGPLKGGGGRLGEDAVLPVTDALIPAAQLPPWRASTPRRGPASMMDGVVTADGGGAMQVG